MMFTIPQRYFLEAHSIAESRPVDEAMLPADIAEVSRYWTARRSDCFAPSLRQFKLDELPPSVLPLATLVDVREQPFDLVYRFWGSERTHQQGVDYTGKSVKDVRPEIVSEKIQKEYAAVCREKVPLHFISSRTMDDGTKLEYHFIRLPLSADGEKVTNIFCTEFNRSLEIS